MSSSVVNSIAQAWPHAAWRDCHVLVALSGGADSVALLRGLHAIRASSPGNGKICAAHFNHGLRGVEAQQDAAWVKELCETLEIPLTVGHASSAIASEESARDGRYEFLTATAHSLGARFLATAHTADDQVETVLMRVLRGSGIDGLAGIPATRPASESVSLARPLLRVRRAEVEAYLAEIGQPYRTDRTNAESLYTRNWFRNELLPLLRDRLGGDVDGAVLRLADQAGEWRTAIEELVSPLLECAFATENNQTLAIDPRPLAGLPSILVRQACRHAWRSLGWPEQQMSQHEWLRLAASLAGPCDAFVLPGGVDVRWVGDKLVLSLPA